MAKIDTTNIAGYAEMSTEEKLAALEAFEYEDRGAEVDRLKSLISKANSEAAEWKRKHKELLSDDEAKKQEDAEHLAKVEKELAELRRDKTVSEYKAKYLSLGYKEDLAEETAKALADGDTARVFANQQKFNDDYAKSLKASALRDTPRPGVGGGSEGIDYADKINEAASRGDTAAVAYYTRLQAMEERQARE